MFRKSKLSFWTGLILDLGLFFVATGYIMIREATEDTVVQVPNPLGQDGTTPFPIPKGVQVSPRSA